MRGLQPDGDVLGGPAGRADNRLCGAFMTRECGLRCSRCGKWSALWIRCESGIKPVCWKCDDGAEATT
jgi:hypothetical protein